MKSLLLIIFNLIFVLFVLPLLLSPRMVVVHLNAAPPNKNPGPVMSSSNTYIKLGCKEGGEEQVMFDPIPPPQTTTQMVVLGGSCLGGSCPRGSCLGVVFQGVPVVKCSG